MNHKSLNDNWYKCCCEEDWSIFDGHLHGVDPCQDEVLPDQGQDIAQELTGGGKPKYTVLDIMRGHRHEGHKTMLEHRPKGLHTEEVGKCINIII